MISLLKLFCKQIREKYANKAKLNFAVENIFLSERFNCPLL